MSLRPFLYFVLQSLETPLTVSREVESDNELPFNLEALPVLIYPGPFLELSLPAILLNPSPQPSTFGILYLDRMHRPLLPQFQRVEEQCTVCLDHE